jgi:serine/threonine protein kinase
MKSNPVPPDELALAQRIDRICDRFEAACRKARTGGARPQIEDFLPTAPESERLAVLPELIVLEIHHRRQRGEQPAAGDYQSRFPTLDAKWLVNAVAAGRAMEVGSPFAAAPEATGPYVPAPAGPSSEPSGTLDPALGRARTFGTYELLTVIGRGGMGIVYKARQRGLKRVVALKMILSGAEAGPQELARFRLEAEALGDVPHPNIVQIFEVGEYEGWPFIALEYVEGGSLARELDGTPWPARRAATLVETLARAMHSAHEAGLVHRDLKPANVLLKADGTPKITDFGLVKRLDDQPGLTASDVVMGTPSYMAPEQAKGLAKKVGPPADIYALGATLYQLLTGRPPFKGETPLDTIREILSEDPVPPRQLNARVSRDLEAICLKCLEKEPGRRYPSAQSLADDLRRFLAGESVRARPVRVWDAAVKWSRRNPVLAIVTVTAILGSCLGIVTNPLFFQASRMNEWPDQKDPRPYPRPPINQAIRPTVKSSAAAPPTSQRFPVPTMNGPSR